MSAGCSALPLSPTTTPACSCLSLSPSDNQCLCNIFILSRNVRRISLPHTSSNQPPTTMRALLFESPFLPPFGACTYDVHADGREGRVKNRPRFRTEVYDKCGDLKQNGGLHMCVTPFPLSLSPALAVPWLICNPTFPRRSLLSDEMATDGRTEIGANRRDTFPCRRRHSHPCLPQLAGQDPREFGSVNGVNGGLNSQVRVSSLRLWSL